MSGFPKSALRIPEAPPPAAGPGRVSEAEAERARRALPAQIGRARAVVEAARQQIANTASLRRTG